jgi:glutaconyl-CoA/methylmalonyl-CoA decarboxylase subunit gamma
VKKFKVTVDGQEYVVEVEELGQDQNSELSVTAKPVTAVAPPVGSVVKNTENNSSKKDDAVGDSVVKAPMPGSVLDVKVGPGDKVNSGDILIVLEAMKMENELTAPQDGTIKDVFVKKGDTVNSGDPLIVLS